MSDFNNIIHNYFSQCRESFLLIIVVFTLNIARWRALTLIACGLLAGCGLTQTVTDGTVSITESFFFKKIKTLHLDFTPRTAINADGAQTPLATMVRIYQLSDRKASDYQTLLRRADTVLKYDVLVSKELLVMPFSSRAS